MSRLSKIALGLLLLSLLSSSAIANPWTRRSGSFYIQPSYSFIAADEFYGPGGNRVPIVDTYLQQHFSLYTEVGVIDRWLTVVYDGVLFRNNEITDVGSTSGLGDMKLGVWSGLITAPVRLSAGLIVGLPTGDPSPTAGPGAQPGADLIARSLPTGDGEWDIEFPVAVGHSFGGGGGFWPLEHYAIARVSYWLRTSTRASLPGATSDEFADAVNWHLELGSRLPWTFVDRFWLIFRIFGSESFASDTEAQAAGFSGLGNGVEHRSFGLTLLGRIWNGISASASADGAFSARGIAAGANVKFALIYEY